VRRAKHAEKRQPVLDLCNNDPISLVHEPAANQPPAGKAATRTARAARSPPTAGSGPSRRSTDASPLTAAVGRRNRALIGLSAHGLRHSERF
jgi:hypothetical protein